jgi:hypothetical protein
VDNPSPSSRWAVTSLVIGIGLVLLYTALCLTSVARTSLVAFAAIGPFLWLMRAGREVVRLFDGRSTPDASSSMWVCWSR